MPLLNVALVPGPDQVVVRLTGDADLSTEPLVADALAQAAGLGSPQVVVDLARVRFWDCSGLHALAAVTRDLAAADRACRVVGAQPATRRLIAMANLAGELHLDGPLAAGGVHRGSVSVLPGQRGAPRRAAPVTGGLVAAGHDG